MTKKQGKKKSSRTAAMTCMSRAASFLDNNPYYHSDDDLALKLLPVFIKTLFHIPMFRNFFVRFIAPYGVYEYVIARTKYIDSIFEKALADRFDQILIFGAGFDTRALRFHKKTQNTVVFELDEHFTQKSKIKQLKKRHLNIPVDLVFIGIDFEKEPLAEKLDMANFQKGLKTLFIFEGVLMYLEPASITKTFQTIKKFGTFGNVLVFDYIRKSVLERKNMLYGEKELRKSVHKVGEPWKFGIEPSEFETFVEKQGFRVKDHKCADALEQAYFQDDSGKRIGRVNDTHCIATVEFR